MAISELYRHPFGLLTDLYQLTMMAADFAAGVADRNAVFHLTFRKPPFGSGYSISCGQETVREILADLRFESDDLDYLRSLTGNDDRPLFTAEFLERLRDFEFLCDVDAPPEGTVVFPHEPLLRVRGPVWQCRLIETLALCVINFQTLIATKASRICWAAGDDPVIEFGLRRAQGIDGGLSASRAAYVGGCVGTSNVLAGKTLGIPVKGTHAHSWVMTFDDEPTAFREYAAAMPNNCIFLVDTYDTLAGVRNAIEMGRELRNRGHEMVGIRLDSGDLAELSIAARQLLDDADFPNAGIVASNDLDETTIESLKSQGAKINVWGVGTNLVTGADQPALGGVYKLSAIEDEAGDWQPRVKLSEQAIKTSTPGILQIARFHDGDRFAADIIFDERDAIASSTDPWELVDPLDATRRRTIESNTPPEFLLQPMFRSGQSVGTPQSPVESRNRAITQRDALPRGMRRLLNPHEYPVGLEAGLHQRKTELILAARSGG